MLKFANLFKKKSAVSVEVMVENKQLIRDMQYVCSRLNEVRATYDMVTDDMLIDSLISEENALVAKYTYMLQLAKERKITNIPMVSV